MVVCARMANWCLCSFLLLAATCLAAPPKVEPFGTTADGQPVEAYTLTNSKGMSVKIITYGATIVDLIVPDRNGKPTDVALGYDTLAGYESASNPYFGCTVGRVANRIGGAKFTLDGKTYQLTANEGPNMLHGGTKNAFHRKVWKAVDDVQLHGKSRVTLQCVSPDGEEGFPGTLTTRVTFMINDNFKELSISYRAETDQKTPVNLTNHTYFNLSGEGSETALDHTLQVMANKYTPTDMRLIPTGQQLSVEGTPLDFRQPRKLQDKLADLATSPAKSYDHNLILEKDTGITHPVAILSSPKSGIRMQVLSTEPAVQLYAGVGLNVRNGKHAHTYAKHSAVCLESQRFPDAVNQNDFPSIIVYPGQENAYRQSTSWTFTAEPAAAP